MARRTGGRSPIPELCVCRDQPRLCLNGLRQNKHPRIWPKGNGIQNSDLRRQE